MAEVASAYVTLLPSAKGFGRKLDSGISGDIDSSGRRAGKGFGLAFGRAFAAVGAALGVGHFLSDSIGEAREAQKVGALTNQVIKSTGGVAKVSAKHVSDLATSLSNKIGVDDEAIQHGENLLLTFKNVRNELGKGNQIFDRATKAAADLSAAGFGDLSGTSKQLGKALNDPVKGVTALARSGVTFTDQQKKQIKAMVKSGNVLGAQKIVLKEVESQVGGAAAAQATAGDKLGVAFKNLEESVGTALLPLFDKVATFLTNKAIPALYELGPAFKKVSGFVKPAIDAFRSMADGSGRTGERVQQFKVTVSEAFVELKSIFQSTVSILTSLWARFGGTLTAAADRAITSILNIVRGGLRVLDGVFKLVAALLKGDWSGAWDAIKEIASGALLLLKGIIQGGVNTLKTTFGLIKDALKGVMDEAWRGVRSGARAGIELLVGILKALPGKIVDAVGDLSKTLYDAGVDLIQGLIDGIGSKTKDLFGKLGDLTGKIPIHKGPPAKDRKLLRPNGRLIIGGLISGISDEIPALESQLSGLTTRIPQVSTAGIGASSAAEPTSGGSSGAQFHVDKVYAQDVNDFLRQMQQRSRLAAADGMSR